MFCGSQIREIRPYATSVVKSRIDANGYRIARMFPKTGNGYHGREKNNYERNIYENAHGSGA